MIFFQIIWKLLANAIRIGKKVLTKNRQRFWENPNESTKNITLIQKFNRRSLIKS